MTEKPAQRRLAAIAVADVVGYSRLMEADEAGTLAALKQRRKEIVEPTVYTHGGRIVKVMGDGVLIEFASAVGAVAGSLELQKKMERANSDLPEERRIALRIGINLGDVIGEGTDIYGDGVNIAARLEALAESGGIVASRKIHDEVAGKLPVHFEDMGEQSLKNIARPVRVYKVGTGKPAAASMSAPSAKPSIAVLPFVNMSDDPEQQYFSDGIAEDIITGLSRYRSLLVISRNSSFTFQERSLSTQTFAQQLGVQYVVEGSVRKAENQVRVTVQLIESATGRNLWAERYDRALTSIFAVQDEITQGIVTNLAGRLDSAAGESALRRGPENLSKYDLLLQGKYFLNRGAKNDILRARELFQKALDLDASDAQVYVGLAASYAEETRSDWTDDWNASARKVFELAGRAVELDSHDSQAHLMLAWAYFHVRSNFDMAASQVDKAIELNPNDYNNYCFKSWLLTCSGDTEGGIVCASEALRRNPLAPMSVSGRLVMPTT